MGAIQRQSRMVENNDDGTNVFPQSASPIIIPHGSFVGLSISLSTAAIVTVHADAVKDGDFDTEVDMLGTGLFLYPEACAANILYNAAYIKIAWDTGSIRVFQKG